jgi:hypothetical protein
MPLRPEAHRPSRAPLGTGGRPLFATISALLVTVALLLATRPAAAERELIVPFHESGHLVLDQLAGLRLNPTGGASLAGAAGAATRSSKADATTPGGASTETSSTSLWLSPSADVFVTDHLSLGGMIAIEHTWGAARTGGRSLELPGTTSMTFLPRVGFFAPFGDRLGLWPRAGLGWTSTESASFDAAGGAVTRETTRALLLDVDVALVYRFNEMFYMRAGPEVGVTLGGQRTVESAGTTSGGGTSTLQISGVLGFGMNIEL